MEHKIYEHRGVVPESYGNDVQAHLKDNAPTKTEAASVKKAWLKEAWPELEKPSLMNLAQKKWKEREGN